MKQLFIILIFTLSLSLYANESSRIGYIIKLNGDTIHGYLLYQKSLTACKSCKFKEKPEDEYILFNPNEITGYRFQNDKFYVSKELMIDSTGKSSTVFMEYLIDGIIDLYFYADYNENHYYIEKTPGKLIELPNKIETTPDNHVIPSRYKGILRSLMFDCSDIEEYINKTELGHKSLINLAKTYHTKVCGTESCIIFQRSNLKSLLELEAIVGLSLNQYNFGNRLTSNYEKCFQFGIGLKIKNTFFSNEQFNIKISFLLEKDSKYVMSPRQDYAYNYPVNYNNIDYNLSSRNAMFTVPKLSVRLNVIDLKIPVVFNYNYVVKRSELYAGLGLTDKIVISANNKYRDIAFYNQYGKTFRGFLVGAIGNIGFNKYLDKDHAIGINIMYEYLVDPKALNEFLRLMEKQFSIQISYVFK